MFPLLLLGLTLYFATKPSTTSSSSTATASNGATVAIPGLVLPKGYSPTSADVATMRAFINGTYRVGDETSGSLSAAQRLSKLNENLGYYVTDGRMIGLDAFFKELE